MNRYSYRVLASPAASSSLIRLAEACQNPCHQLRTSTIFTPQLAPHARLSPQKTALHCRSQAERETAQPAGDTNRTGADDAPSSSSSSRAAAKGFGPQPVRKERKPPKESVASDSAKPVTSRRPAPARPVLVPKGNPEARQRENVFVLCWTILAIVILLEGLTLAASGLLPEEWDDVLVKYLYPAFTPTVLLFLVGAVVYGVYKAYEGALNSDMD